jgi:hypothetical protein
MAFYIQSVDSGLYLDVKGEQESAGVEVIVYTFHGKRNQQWKYNNGMIISKLNKYALHLIQFPRSYFPYCTYIEYLLFTIEGFYACFWGLDYRITTSLNVIGTDSLSTSRSTKLECPRTVKCLVTH